MVSVKVILKLRKEKGILPIHFKGKLHVFTCLGKKLRKPIPVMTYGLVIPQYM